MGTESTKCSKCHGDRVYYHGRCMWCLIARLESENAELRESVSRIEKAQTVVRKARDGTSIDVTLEKLRLLDAAIDEAREGSG